MTSDESWARRDDESEAGNVSRVTNPARTRFRLRRDYGMEAIYSHYLICTPVREDIKRDLRGEFKR